MSESLIQPTYLHLDRLGGEQFGFDSRSIVAQYIMRQLPGFGLRCQSILRRHRTDF